MVLKVNAIKSANSPPNNTPNFKVIKIKNCFNAPLLRIKLMVKLLMTPDAMIINSSPNILTVHNSNVLECNGAIKLIVYHKTIGLR